MNTTTDITDRIRTRAENIAKETSSQASVATGKGRIITAGSFEIHPLSQRIFNSEAQEITVMRGERGENNSVSLTLETGEDGFIIPPGEAVEFAKAIILVALFGKNTNEETDELIRQAIGESEGVWEEQSEEDVTFELRDEVEQLFRLREASVDQAIREEVIEQFGSLRIGLEESFGKSYESFKEDSELTDQELYTAVAYAQSEEFAEIRKKLDENASYQEITTAYNNTPIEGIFEVVYNNSGCRYGYSLKPKFVNAAVGQKES